MKIIRFILILSAFLIMISAILNLLNGTEAAQPDRTPIYIDLVVMFLLMTCVVLLNGVEKKFKKLKDNSSIPPKKDKFFSEEE